ncbi:hypothetical protein PUN28_004949 [Cardiocondyla obscurior]|uniref:Uncharacterized protein n=1 Tax=Cardiocondyla obscurior TaxID=286306 RepID=A0AAW2GD87_9HYME
MPPSTNRMSFAPPETSARSARTTRSLRTAFGPQLCASRRRGARSAAPTTPYPRARHHYQPHHQIAPLPLPSPLSPPPPPATAISPRLPISRPSASSGPRSAAGSPSRSLTPPKPTFVPRDLKSRRFAPRPLILPDSVAKPSRSG